MSAVSFLKMNNSITLHYDGKTKLVAAGDPNFDLVVKAIREKRLDDIPEIVEPERYFKDNGLDVEDGLITLNGDAMPPELNARIIEYKQEKLPFDSLLKFWDNLAKNPSFNSRKELFKFLENQGHSITEDGCFIGYRGVRDDFKDKHTGKFDNSPGKVVSVPRSQVDDNPANDCSYGLHVGGYNYAKAFGPKLVMVKVNPQDVVAVPSKYGGEKMRVCKFEVLSETSSPVQGPVHDTSGYDVEKAELSEQEMDDVLSSKEKPKKTVKIVMTAAEKRAHKRKYKNNHAKRGPNGAFIAKKKAKKGNRK